MKMVYFDTETTGLNPGQIAQLSFIVENNGEIECAKNYFFNVDTMEEGAQKVHGLSIEKLREYSNGKTFKDCKDEIYNYFRDSLLIAHNIQFDEKFIGVEFLRSGIKFNPLGSHCTMNYFKDIMKIPARNTRYGKYKNPKLEELVDYYNIDKKKVMEYSSELYGSGDITFHDSRYDTACMFVAVNVYRETLGNRSTIWRDRFCK